MRVFSSSVYAHLAVAVLGILAPVRLDSYSSTPALCSLH